MAEVSIIKLTFEDPRCETATRLMFAQHLEICERYNDPVDENLDHLVPEGVVGPGGAFVIVWFDDQAVGCGSIRPFPYGSPNGRPGGELNRIYVEPAYRGMRLAQRIVEALETFGIEFGFSFIILETGYKQPEAIRLYERMGYTVTPCFPPYLEEGGSVCYIKHIGMNNGA